MLRIEAKIHIVDILPKRGRPLFKTFTKKVLQNFGSLLTLLAIREDYFYSIASGAFGHCTSLPPMSFPTTIPFKVQWWWWFHFVVKLAWYPCETPVVKAIAIYSNIQFVANFTFDTYFKVSFKVFHGFRRLFSKVIESLAFLDVNDWTTHFMPTDMLRHLTFQVTNYIVSNIQCNVVTVSQCLLCSRILKQPKLIFAWICSYLTCFVSVLYSFNIWVTPPPPSLSQYI